jgi:hypothetical protein
MNKHLAALFLILPLSALAAQEKKVETIDPRVIHAPLEQRRKWVIEQAEGRGADSFSSDYAWVIAAKSIGSKEATQLAYLFFYSTRTMGGYFDEPVRDGDIFKLTFHSELGPVVGFPIFVDAKTGSAWQEGQKERVDMLSLIKLFIKHRKEDQKKPNQALRPTAPSGRG